MQPSARSPAPTPRSVPYRSPSTQSIEVEHEISVISSRANSMKNSTGRPSISWSRPYASSAERARTSHGGRSPSPVVSPHRGTRSNSVSRLLSRSYSGGLGRAGADLDFAESIGDGNKESGSITEMAEFLRNKVFLFMLQVTHANGPLPFRSHRQIIGYQFRMRRFAPPRNHPLIYLDAGAAAGTDRS